MQSPTSVPLKDLFSGQIEQSEIASRELQKAMINHKREGLALAFTARMIALAAVAVFLLFVVPWPNVVVAEAYIAAFALVGWLQRKYGRAGQSRLEMLLAFCDFALMTLVVVVPNPLAAFMPPTPVQFHYDTFHFVFIILAGTSISLHWRTLVSIAAGAPLIWLAGVIWVWLTFQPVPELTELAAKMFGNDPNLTLFFDPNAIHWGLRIQEVVIFVLVALILALNGRRAEQLLARFAEGERKRTNLSRYFSPNVINELAHSDELLRQTRLISVAVLFVDIVGFTRFAASVKPVEAMAALQTFFARMERAVFSHNGTLDKYLGDGLMATFGTPVPGKNNAIEAVRCVHAMLAEMDEWNRDRAKSGLPPIRIGIGVHYGEVAFGNIGVDRLELAVIGDSVNIASRLESLTRDLEVAVVASAALIARARAETSDGEPALSGFKPMGQQPISGTKATIAVAALAHR